MLQKVVIVDYRMGNLHSISKRIARLKCTPLITSDSNEILNADKIILPGVGHFGKAMDHLMDLNLLEALNEYAQVRKKPILGICLGAQLMARNSEEGNSIGLGWLDMSVVRFTVEDRVKFKIPHTGWNQIRVKKESDLLQGLSSGTEFYFVHSYYIKTNNESDVLCETEYEHNFVSAVNKENIYGVQFHPEKSHDAGNQLLKNFINL